MIEIIILGISMVGMVVGLLLLTPTSMVAGLIIFILSASVAFGIVL